MIIVKGTIVVQADLLWQAFAARYCGASRTAFPVIWKAAEMLLKQGLLRDVQGSNQNSTICVM